MTFQINSPEELISLPIPLPLCDQIVSFSKSTLLLFAGNQDILICGNCREMYTDLHDLLEHKKTYCKLRFTCKCDSNKSSKFLFPLLFTFLFSLPFIQTNWFLFIEQTESPTDDHSSAALLCVQCKDAFQNAWDLMVHAQAAHMLNIYELGVPALAHCSSPPLSPRDNNSPDKVSYTYTKL